ncbi:MFS transporter [Speluncibacter jeojiensis]|uniref:MFS transporter n=1 Tax=Speluncibacter jeojiensis TaxID=2710754 RepID=A0A9X4M4W9_9ACTN|nr:MFS transporter [Corynebacteriales bacterium D3-21]
MNSFGSTPDIETRGPAEDSGAGWSPKVILSLFSMALVLELLSISYLLISVALPQISANFHTTQSAWLLTSFLLLGAVTSPLIGRLADTHGKRKLLLWCIGLAAVGSLLSALASSFAILVVGRALTGMLSPTVFLVYTLIRDVFPPRTVAMSVSVSISGMGLVAIPAPFLAGWLIDNFGFRSLFWFTLICLVVLAPVIMLTTDESPVRLSSRLDWVGAVLLGLGLAGVLMAVSFGPDWGWTDASTVAYLVGGLVLMGAWLVSARRVKQPLIDTRLLMNRPVALTALASGLVYGAIAVFTIVLPFMAMSPSELGLGYGFGVDAEGFAYLQAPLAAATVLGGVVVGRLVKRVDPRVLMVVGLGLMAVGAAVTALSHGNEGMVIVFGAIVGLGTGIGYASTPNLLLTVVPQSLQATTGALASVSQNVLPAVMPVIAFAVLNSHIATVLQGQAFYSDTGISIGYLIAAGTAVVGVVAALALPRKTEASAELQELAAESGGSDTSTPAAALLL